MDIKNRIDLERKIISSMLHYESSFTDVLALGISPEVFISQETKTVYEIMIEAFYDEGEYPGLKLAEKYIDDDQKFNLLKQFLISSEIMYDIQKAVFVLLDDNIDREVRKIFQSKTDQKGLDKAFLIQDEIQKVITRNYESLKEDENSIERVVTEIKSINAGEPKNYIPTGIKSLDDKIIGIYKKGLTVIAARPSMGKTALMTQLKRNFNDSNLGVGIISIEESKEAIHYRDISALTKINSQMLESGRMYWNGEEIKLSSEDIKKVEEAADNLSKQNCQINDDGYQTLDKIKAAINKWRIKNKIDVVMIDYLQQIKPDKAERYDLAIGQITKELYQFSKKTSIPIILFSQLNRAVEARNEKRPLLSDLRESGNIEQDARMVLLLYRPGYYNTDARENELEIIIAKNRGGRTGIAKTEYQKEYHLITDLNNQFPSRVAPEDNWYENKEYPM